MAGARFLGIIPARGGSKGLPRKNVLPLAGKPLIAHSIDAARGCPLIGGCVVSTEDPEIKAVALAHGAQVIDRPMEFATDTARTHDAVRHVIEILEARDEMPEHIVLLQPTSPLRTAAHLTECIAAYLASGAASALSLTEAEHHPYKDFLIEDGRMRPLFGEDGLERPRQALPKVYRQNGAIYLIAARLFLERNAFYVQPALPYLMPAAASIDIDGALDLALAELIATGAM